MTQLISRPCCDSHEDWPHLTQHLVESFPDIPLVEIVAIVNRTRQAEKAFGLPDAEHLATAEIIVRHQLIQLAGLGRSTPRLVPESHPKRRTTPQAARPSLARRSLRAHDLTEPDQGVL
jgi:hypothetical protein